MELGTEREAARPADRGDVGVEGERRELDAVSENGSAPRVEAAAEGAAESREPAADREAPAPPEKSRPSERLVSLDAFRGLTILGMLLVNNIALGGATPDQFQHAPWGEGVRMADLVFPWFLLIVGVSIPYAVGSHRRKGLPLWSYDLKALGRAVTLVLLGCLIDSSLNKRPTFGLGVLQLIGLAYLVGAILGVLPVWARLTVAGLLLTAHWWAIRFLSLPGHVTGSFTEAQNLVTHLNQLFLARYHLNGLVSVIPTAGMVLIGSAAGELLRLPNRSGWWKAGVLAGGGAGLTLLGWLWSLDLPFSKAVWTSPYILYTAGLGTLTLAAFFAVMDVLRFRRWAFPLVVFGMNAIVAYVAPILVKIYVLREWLWTMPDGTLLPLEQAWLRLAIDHYGRVPGGWIYTLGYILVWWLVLLELYRRKLFLRV